MKILKISIISLVSIAVLSAAGYFYLNRDRTVDTEMMEGYFSMSDPSSLMPGETIQLNYVCHDIRGDYRWKAEAEITKKYDDVFEMTEKGEGIYSSFDGKISWEARMEYKEMADTIKPMSLDKKVYDAEGNVIRIEKQEFDIAKNTATCTHQEPVNNVKRTKTFEFDTDAVNRLSLGLYAQKLLKSGKTKEKVQMVSEEPNMYNMVLKVVGKEVVEVNGREVLAYKLSIDPQLGMLNFAKAFFPRSYAWHSAGPGFEWLKYSGLEGDIKSREVEVTAKEYKEK